MPAPKEIKIIKVALVDDHKLFRKGLAELINNFPGYIVSGDFEDGSELKKGLGINNDPDIILLDINMPELTGYEIAAWLKEVHPQIKVLALSMNGNETSILRMVKAGARGYILKDVDPSELKLALDLVIHKGYYHSELFSTTLVNNYRANFDSSNSSNLNDKEIKFLELACSELTYKEIADRMNLSPRTIDGYRESLFEKLNIKSRVGLVMFAIKNNIVSVL